MSSTKMTAILSRAQCVNNPSVLTTQSKAVVIDCCASIHLLLVSLSTFLNNHMTKD